MGQYKTCRNFWGKPLFFKGKNDCCTTINENSTIVPLWFGVWWNAWCFWKNVAMTAMYMWNGHFCLFLLSFHGSGTLIRVLCFFFQSLSLGFSLHPTKKLIKKIPRYSSFPIHPLQCLELDAFSSFSKVWVSSLSFFIHLCSTGQLFFSLSLSPASSNFDIMISSTSWLIHIHVTLMPAFFHTPGISAHTELQQDNTVCYCTDPVKLFLAVCPGPVVSFVLLPSHRHHLISTVIKDGPVLGEDKKKTWKKGVGAVAQLIKSSWIVTREI